MCLILSMLKYKVFNTEIGEVALTWDSKDEIIKQVILPDFNTGKYNYSKSMYHGVVQEDNPSEYITSLIESIQQITQGIEVKFTPEQMDLSELTDFQREVLLKQLEIPHKKVTSYKKLATLIGRNKSARPLANALASNPFPLIIPCHRTLRSDWKIGGYSGTNDGTIKQKILENEGVQFENGIAKKEYRYLKYDIEELNSI